MKPTILNKPTTRVRLDEYLRRNLAVCKAVGLVANARVAHERLCQRKNGCELWLGELLCGIIDRGERVAEELAAHRDELMPKGGER